MLNKYSGNLIQSPLPALPRLSAPLRGYRTVAAIRQSVSDAGAGNGTAERLCGLSACGHAQAGGQRSSGERTRSCSQLRPHRREAGGGRQSRRGPQRVIAAPTELPAGSSAESPAQRLRPLRQEGDKDNDKTECCGLIKNDMPSRTEHLFSLIIPLTRFCAFV